MPHNSQRWIDRLILAYTLFAAFVILLCALLLTHQAHARDLGQNSDPVVKKWFEGLMQPDNPVASCCGEADGYWCDDISTEGQDNYCRITDDRIIQGRAQLPVGTRIRIPNEKMLEGKLTRGNPTGHSYIFVSSGGSYVYCFIMGSQI